MILLVGTHADAVSTKKDDKDSRLEDKTTKLVIEVQKQFSDDLFIADHVFICDARQSSHAEVIALRQCLAEVKLSLREVTEIILCIINTSLTFACVCLVCVRVCVRVCVCVCTL